MTRIIAALATAAALSLVAIPGAAEAQAQAGGIAYINSQEIINQWPAAREAMEEFQREVTQAQTRVETMEREIVELQEELERQQGTMSQEAQQQRISDLQERFAAYQESRGQLEGQLETSQHRRMNRLREQITATVEQVRSERNVAIVIDQAAAGMVAADPSLDLTQEILRRLNR